MGNSDTRTNNLSGTPDFILVLLLLFAVRRASLFAFLSLRNCQLIGKASRIIKDIGYVYTLGEINLLQMHLNEFSILPFNSGYLGANIYFKFCYVIQ